MDIASSTRSVENWTRARLGGKVSCKFIRGAPKTFMGYGNGVEMEGTLICCIVVIVALLFYVHGKHLRSCRDGQLT